MKYDDASWHYGGTFPKGLPKRNGGTHIGMFLAWMIAHDLVSDELRDDAAKALARVRARKMTGTAFLFTECDEKLTDHDFSAEGNRFALDYFEGAYIDDYLRTFKVRDDGSVYTVADTWENYERLRPAMDRAYAAFANKKVAKKKVATKKRAAKKRAAKKAPAKKGAAKAPAKKRAPKKRARR